MVPLGEVAVTPSLPRQALSLAGLGRRLTGAGSDLATIGSATVRLIASAGPGTTGLLRAGMTGTAVSEVSGATLRVRIASVRSRDVTFTPIGRVPPGLLGSNVQVDVVSRRVRSLTVPVAALNTSASGAVYVTAVTRSGRQPVVPVRLRLSAGGRRAVTANGKALNPGEQVVIGQQAR
jgi:hypothetical protein